MEKCPLFAIHHRSSSSRENSPSQQRGSGVSVDAPYCRHTKHSPVTLARVSVSATIGTPQLLACSGQIEMCPLSEAERADI